MTPNDTELDPDEFVDELRRELASLLRDEDWTNLRISRRQLEGAEGAELYAVLDELGIPPELVAYASFRALLRNRLRFVLENLAAEFGRSAEIADRLPAVEEPSLELGSPEVQELFLALEMADSIPSRYVASRTANLFQSTSKEFRIIHDDTGGTGQCQKPVRGYLPNDTSDIALRCTAGHDLGHLETR